MDHSLCLAVLSEGLKRNVRGYGLFYSQFQRNFDDHRTAREKNINLQYTQRNLLIKVLYNMQDIQYVMYQKNDLKLILEEN
jgi:hypothetical protein